MNVLREYIVADIYLRMRAEGIQEVKRNSKNSFLILGSLFSVSGSLFQIPGSRVSASWILLIPGFPFAFLDPLFRSWIPRRLAYGGCKRHGAMWTVGSPWSSRARAEIWWLRARQYLSFTSWYDHNEGWWSGGRA